MYYAVEQVKSIWTCRKIWNPERKLYAISYALPRNLTDLSCAHIKLCPLHSASDIMDPIHILVFVIISTGIILYVPFIFRNESSAIKGFNVYNNNATQYYLRLEYCRIQLGRSCSILFFLAAISCLVIYAF